MAKLAKGKHFKSRKPTAAPSVAAALATRFLDAADRIVVSGLRAEVGSHTRVFVENVAKKMVDVELGRNVWGKMPDRDRELWVSRAAVALTAIQENIRDLFGG